MRVLLMEVDLTSNPICLQWYQFMFVPWILDPNNMCTFLFFSSSFNLTIFLMQLFLFFIKLICFLFFQRAKIRSNAQGSCGFHSPFPCHSIPRHLKSGKIHKIPCLCILALDCGPSKFWASFPETPHAMRFEHQGGFGVIPKPDLKIPTLGFSKWVQVILPNFTIFLKKKPSYISGKTPLNKTCFYC